MDSLECGLRALGLTENTLAVTIEDPPESSEIFYDASEVFHGASEFLSSSHFRLYDLPTELRLRILELYVSTLYPRIVYRCFCYLCEPVSSTTLSAAPNPDFQRALHGTKYQPFAREKELRFRCRFSYCEDLPVDLNLRTLDHGSGRNFDFPYGTGTMPPEPGIFVTSKELRRDTIDVMMRTRPFYVFSQETTYCLYMGKYWGMKYLPVWYREALRYGEELRPHSGIIFNLTAKLSLTLPSLQEVRLNYGRLRMNTTLVDREELEWVPGVPRDLLTGMINRRVRQFMQKICTKSEQGYEKELPTPWKEQHQYLCGVSDAAALLKSSWKRSWKVVVVAEFRVKVRESKRSKRQWASIYVTAREVENCSTYSLDIKLGNHLLELEQNVENCLCLVARSGGEDKEA